MEKLIQKNSIKNKYEKFCFVKPEKDMMSDVCFD